MYSRNRLSKIKENEKEKKITPYSISFFRYITKIPIVASSPNRIKNFYSYLLSCMRAFPFGGLIQETSLQEDYLSIDGAL